MGYTNLPFNARLFCMVYITLPGEASMKRVPCLVSDSCDLNHLLIPTFLATTTMLAEYLDNFFDVDHTSDFVDFHKYQVTSYSVNIAEYDDPDNDPLSSHASDEEIYIAVRTRVFNQTIQNPPITGPSLSFVNLGRHCSSTHTLWSNTMSLYYMKWLTPWDWYLHYLNVFAWP